MQTCSHAVVKALVSPDLVLNGLLGNICMHRSNHCVFMRHFLYLGNKVQHHASGNDPFALVDEKGR